MKQKLRDQTGQIYADADVLAGPWNWQIGDYTFTTVLVKCHSDKGKMLSVIDCRSGMRFGQIVCGAPKTKPNLALQAVSELITQRRQDYGDARVVSILENAAPIS